MDNTTYPAPSSLFDLICLQDVGALGLFNTMHSCIPRPLMALDPLLTGWVFFSINTYLVRNGMRRSKHEINILNLMAPGIGVIVLVIVSSCSKVIQFLDG